MKRFLKKYMTVIIAVLCVIVIYGVMFALDVTCPIKHLTGVSCPGCGMTRACVSALKLDFASAFYYHPLWILLPFAVPALVILFIKRRYKAFFVMLGAVMLAFVAVYLYRLLYLEGDVVVWETEKGILSNIFS